MMEALLVSTLEKQQKDADSVHPSLGTVCPCEGFPQRAKKKIKKELFTILVVIGYFKTFQPCNMCYKVFRYVPSTMMKLSMKWQLFYFIFFFLFWHRAKFKVSCTQI